jgi:hypothetical protein
MPVVESKGVDTIPYHLDFVGTEAMSKVDSNVEGPLRNYDTQHSEQHPWSSVEHIEIKRFRRER